MNGEDLDTKRYYEYINNIINTRGQGNIIEGEYFEEHHIKLRCFGGEGKRYEKHVNIVGLYADEHFNAHKILAEDNNNVQSILSAGMMMAYPKGNTSRNKISSDEYKQLREFFSVNQLGTANPSHNDNVKQKISRSTKGRVPSNRGKHAYSNGEVTVYADSCPEGFIRYGSKRRNTMCVETGEIFSNTADAGKSVNLCKTVICKACKTGKIVGGYHGKGVERV